VDRIQSQYLTRTFLLVSILVVLLAGIFLRVYDLERDPPMDIGLSAEDLSTDPHHLTSFSAQESTFGKWEPFPYPKWHVFSVSLPSGLSFILFTLFDTSRYLANLTGSLLAIAGLVLMLCGFYVDKKKPNLIGLLAAALFVSFNFLLVTYQRMPFMETALFFYFGLVFFLLQKYRFQLWNIAVVSALIPLACFTGKMIGLALAPAVLLTILIAAETNRLKSAGMFLLGFSVSALLFLVILFGSRIPDYLFYLREQTLVSHGQLYIYEGFLRVVARIISFGSAVHLFGDSPMLLLTVLAAAVGIGAHGLTARRVMRRDIPLVFGLSLLFFLLLLLMPVNYRPLRYATTLFFPFGLVIYGMFRLPEEKTDQPTILSYALTGLLLALVVWYVVTHAVVDFFYRDIYKDILWTVAVYSVVPSVLLAVILLIRSMRNLIVMHWPKVCFAILLAGVVSMCIQLFAFYDWHRRAVYSLRDASNDLQQIVGDDAVITGPYAPTLTVGTHIKHFIYSFGLTPPDFDFFSEFGITHTAVDRGNIEVAARDFSEMKDTYAITEYFIRNTIVRIQGIRSNFLPESQSAYTPTDYERAAAFFQDGQYDSAWIYNERFLSDNPDNRSALLQKLYITAQRRELEPLLALLKELPRRFPDDFAVQITCALNLKRHGMRWNRPELLNEAQNVLQRAMQLNYPNRDKVMRDFQRFQ
jgi:hypothetical protein